MSGQFQDTEDFIFDLNSSDDLDAGSNLPAVRQPGREVAPQPEPQPRVPATEPAPTTRDVVVDDGDDDLGLVSEAINSLMRSPGGRPRDEVTVRTPVPTVQAPQMPTAPGRIGQQQQQVEQQRTPAEQAILNELREERRKRQELERRIDTLARPQQPQQPEQDFDTRFFSNPREVLNEVAQSFATQLASVRLEHDLDLAEIRHGPENFKVAFESYMQQVSDGKNFPLYQRVMQSQSPGEEIMSWYRENTLIQETGGDIQGFKERLRAEILAELGQGGRPAAPQPQADVPRRENGQFAPRHEVRLPTATSRMTGSQVAGNEDNEDGSDDAIFDAGRARNPRR